MWGRSEGVESVPDDPTVIREPSEFHVPIYGGLMRYLFKICRAFVAAGEGNPCRWLKLNNWTNDSHGKMDARRLTNFFKCFPYIQMVLKNTWKGGAIPWTKLIAAAPELELERPTAAQKLGFHGLLIFGRHLEVIYRDFLLARNFASKPALEAAKAAHVEMVISHLHFNPTLQSTNVNQCYSSRYQVIEGQMALIAFCDQHLHELDLLNSKISSGEYEDSLSDQPLSVMLVKEGVITTNSHLEGMPAKSYWF